MMIRRGFTRIITDGKTVLFCHGSTRIATDWENGKRISRGFARISAD